MQQNFEIRGPRLTRTTQHKKNKMYGPDKRLELKIVEKSPRIKIQMESTLPTKPSFKITFFLENIFAKNYGSWPKYFFNCYEKRSRTDKSSLPERSFLLTFVLQMWEMLPQKMCGSIPTNQLS